MQVLKAIFIIVCAVAMVKVVWRERNEYKIAERKLKELKGYREDD